MSHGHGDTQSENRTSMTCETSEKLAVVIFTRTSNRSSPALAPQERMLHQVLVEAGIDTTVTTVIRDLGAGRGDQRRGYQHLERMLTAGEIGTLAVADLGRLGRDPTALRLIERALDQGVQVFTEQGPLVPGTWSMRVMFSALVHEMMASPRIRSSRRNKSRFAE